MQLQHIKAKKQGKEGKSRKNNLIELIRPFNCFLASLATIAGFNLVSPPNLNTWWAALAVFFITGAGNVVNDFFDIERDRINKPYRPLPSGKISKGFAVAISIILFSIGLFFSYIINLELFYLAVLASSLLIIYSGFVKEYKFFGNILVSILVGLTFIAGSLAAGSWENGLFLALLAFIVNWSREIFKDFEEKSPEKWTLASLIGKNGATIAAIILVMIGIIAGAIMSFSLGLFQKILFTLAIGSWAIAIFNTQEPETAQKFIKIGMGLITLALLLPY